MIHDAFFNQLLTFITCEQQLTYYVLARQARGALGAYDQRVIEAERVRNLAILSHAWSRSVIEKTPAEI